MQSQACQRKHDETNNKYSKSVATFKAQIKVETNNKYIYLNKDKNQLRIKLLRLSSKRGK